MRRRASRRNPIGERDFWAEVFKVVMLRPDMCVSDASKLADDALLEFQARYSRDEDRDDDESAPAPDRPEEGIDTYRERVRASDRAVRDE